MGQELAIFDSVPQPRHLPCLECGESVVVEARGNHFCEPERWATYQLFQRRDELAALEGQIAAYLASPRGRFELWDAARRRLQA